MGLHELWPSGCSGTGSCGCSGTGHCGCSGTECFFIGYALPLGIASNNKTIFELVEGTIGLQFGFVNPFEPKGFDT